ncbi:MAG: CxxxxCH/CxxCH domain-containing protein, partial [Candidatus Methanoperedens sp.]|nr:CxxxxCH/CxxCH domain-containing protein [Candidatus Methanoperedens sp.]
DCNACHNASGASPYKANSTPFMNVTRHDNTSLNGANVNCNTCHNSTNRPEPFHFTNWSNGTVEAPGWTGWINGTRANCIDCHVTYNNTAPFFAEPSSLPNWHKGVYGASLNDCYQCHSNLTVLAASDSRASVEMHNVTRFINWNDCNSCHAPKYGGAPKVDNISMSATNSMHATIDGATSSNINPACKACHGGNVSIHKNATASNCTYCHITDKLKFTTKNVSEHILNGTYANTTVNTSRYQQVFCDLCHNNSLANFNDDTPGTKNATTAHYGQNKSANKLMSSGANSTDCVYCHKNTSNMAKWGVLSTSNANISNRGDHTSYSANTVCYDCHVDSKAKPSTFHADELNQGIGSSPNCIGCHDMGSGNKKVDFTITNDSSNIHKNLNSGASAGSYDSANKPCWACHGNGSATAHIDSVYKAPRICENCHINASQPYGALQVAEHYRNGSDIKATNATNNTRSCLACHQNISEMRLSNSDNDAGTFDADNDGVYGTNISAYHYGRKRAELRAGINTSCGYCHQNSSSVFPMSDTNKSIREHTNSSTANVTNATLTCTGSKCHSQGFIHNSSLRKNTTQVWMPGSKDYCAPCHKINDANATKYVYSHNTTATPINEDCGYCHNASSQGINGSTVRVHSP